MVHISIKYLVATRNDVYLYLNVQKRKWNIAVCKIAEHNSLNKSMSCE